ncbi:cytochrome c oxidase subunit II [Rhodohalobacter sp. 8-1]|uniref:cytochrome c oxidase subunit II n=1 Tax=Rhodohalobacter sp. 8-1 TaxID=3131972 RepID=UPI0030EBCCCE
MNRLTEYMLPPARSTLAAETDALFHFINVTSIIFLAGITIAIIYFAWKYRRKSDDDVTPVITHNSKLEIAWSVIPLILVMIVFGWGFTGYMNLATPPDDAYEIHVEGVSWRWDFKYENGATSVNELIVPVDRPIKLIMSSADVIHSFYVPDFRVKRDVLPNRYSSVWFEATETGESTIFCTEYCGTQHSNMDGIVNVMSQDEFDTWLETGTEVDESIPPAERGEALVAQNGCNACHSADGSSGVGPSFAGLWGTERTFESAEPVVADENYIRESILESNSKIVEGYDPVMPSYQGVIDDQQISDIIEYIKTLE